MFNFFKGRRDGFPSGLPQDWGYVKAREGANMFWWLHETVAEADPTRRPLVMWLQGVKKFGVQKL